MIEIFKSCKCLGNKKEINLIENDIVESEKKIHEPLIKDNVDEDNNNNINNDINNKIDEVEKNEIIINEEIKKDE